MQNGNPNYYSNSPSNMSSYGSNMVQSLFPKSGMDMAEQYAGYGGGRQLAEQFGGYGLGNVMGAAAGSGGKGFWDSMLGSTDTNGMKTEGWGGLAMNAIGGLGNAWMGAQKLKLGRDALDQNKKEFEMNWGAQKTATNSALEDRQRARVASNSGAYAPVNDYMKKNGIA